MILARIVGNVVADTRIESYQNLTILMFQPIDYEGNPKGNVLLGVDNCNAGIGDTVVVCDEGGSARMLLDEPEIMTIRTVICGIVDEVTMDAKK